MRLAHFIAKRYLIAKKSHNVINIISAISAIGMAIGTAALIIVLSVYNGFDSLIRSMLGNVEPDLLITPAKGKVFIPEGETYDWIYEQPEVFNMCCILQESVFISYEGRQGLAIAKGVDWIYEEETPVREHMTDGEFRLSKGDIPMAVVGNVLAYDMGINHRFLSPVEIFYPSRTGRISLSDPTGSVNSVKVFPSGTFSINADIDKELIITKIETMRQLLGYEEEVSAVEIRMVPGTGEKRVEEIREAISGKLGPDFKVRNRFQQNEALYKMMRYEKVATYMVLIFAIIIIAFNIFGSLSMLIIEKRNDIKTLQHLGAQESLIKRIFILEGWLISLAGLAGGLVIGVTFTLLQQQFGIIKMPGHFVVQAYPVILSASDIIITVAAVALIGYLIALLPVSLRFREWHE